MSKNMGSSTRSVSVETLSLPSDSLPGGSEIRHIQVDGEAAESFIAEKRIGERIKHLRLKKSMGLVELGRLSLLQRLGDEGEGSRG